MSHKPSDIINEGVAEEHVMASKPVTVAPPTSPPVYRGDFESRGEHKDILFRGPSGLVFGIRLFSRWRV